MSFAYIKRQFIGFQLVDDMYQFIIHYILHINQIPSLNKEIDVISKKYKIELVEQRTISLINMRNNIGPKVDP